MEAQLRRIRTRRNKMRSGEGRKKVIERSLVGQVDHTPLQAPFVPIAMEQVVVSNRQIEKTAGGNPGRIVVVVLGPGCRN